MRDLSLILQFSIAAAGIGGAALILFEAFS